MARRGGFKTQAPKQATLGISIVLWLVGLAMLAAAFAVSAWGPLRD